MRTAWRDAQQHKTLIRSQEALRLRLQGRSLREISVEMGISHTHVARLYRHALDMAAADLTEEAKHAVVLELRRLDALWDINFRRATNLELDISEQQGATDKCLKIVRQRCRMLGLEAPQRIDLGSGTSVLFDDIESLSDEELSKELAGFFNPGYMDGAADGYRRGVEDAKRGKERRPTSKRRASRETREKQQEPKVPTPTVATQGRART